MTTTQTQPLTATPTLFLHVDHVHDFDRECLTVLKDHQNRVYTLLSRDDGIDVLVTPEGHMITLDYDTRFERPLDAAVGAALMEWYA